MTATGLLIAVFASGIIVGSAASALADRSDESGGRRNRLSFIEWLETEMQLTDDQESEIRGVLRQYDADMERLWEEVRPRSNEIRVRARAAIADALTEDQRQVYADMNARTDSIRAARRRDDRDRHEDDDDENDKN